MPERVGAGRRWQLGRGCGLVDGVAPRLFSPLRSIIPGYQPRRRQLVLRACREMGHRLARQGNGARFRLAQWNNERFLMGVKMLDLKLRHVTGAQRQ